MAEARAILLPSGYDDEFVNAVEEDLHCSICHLPLKEPVQTGKCGHRFCRQCLDEHFRRLEINREPLNCPVDRNILIREKDIFPDKATERKILSFIIKCPSVGCQWTGELRSKNDHLASCPLKIVSCTNENCSETMTRNNLQKNLTITCPWRILRCTHCNTSHPECKTESESQCVVDLVSRDSHQADCKKFPFNCSQGCGAVIATEEISTHIQKECPLSIMSCPYDHMGCTAKIQRREIESHLKTAVTLHLDLACVKLSDTQKQLSDTQAQLSNTQVQLNDTQVQLSNIQKKFEETIRELQKKVLSVLEKKVQCSEENCNNYSFTWRIDGFSKLMRRAKKESAYRTRIDSSPFYCCGYKCKLSLNPNGVGIGEHTHLSIFLIIMKGKNDATLDWPFHEKVTFTLIDQQENANAQNIVDFFHKAHPGPELLRHFARPVTDENIGYGLFEFAPHKTLKDRCYIVDDTILIQLQISSPK